MEGAEVTLDEMPYGNFVEIEGEQAAIGRVVDALRLHDAKRMPGELRHAVSYVKQNMGLDFTDLTFENFKGIKVPESAFAET